MSLSRRKLLQALTAGATAAAAAPALAWPHALGAGPEPPRASMPGGPILLNANENAYGCSPRLLDALHEAANFANRYPVSTYGPLTERIAAMHKVTPDHVLLGVGSTEILRMAPLAFTGAGKKTVMASPTYEVVARQTTLAGAELDQVPLAADWTHDLDAILAHTDARTGLVYVCNPNNPTATITPRKDLETFFAKLPSNAYILLDEAYHHYVEPSDRYVSFLDKPIDHPRLIVARTFSKIYAMAGMRLGYAIAPPDVVTQLRAHHVDNGITNLTARVALTALDDTETAAQNAKTNAADRQEFFRQVRARKLKAMDSQANFAMFETGRPVEQVIAYFTENNISVGRKFPPLNTHLRVSFGTPPQMKEFWRVWDLMPAASSTQSKLL